LFKEPLTKLKITSILMTIIGTSFVAGIVPLDPDVLHVGSLLFGLGSGIGYALYSIFSKFALKKYTSLVITTFNFVVTGMAFIPFFPYKQKLLLLLDPTVLFYVVGLGFLPTAFAYIIYTYGLEQTEASSASILTTVEPVVATLIGVFVFHEA